MIKAEEALKRLIEGNKRFINNESIHPNRRQETKDDLLEKQAPYAVVLSCSDSRVPIEIIFDAGFGDIFVIRTAGQVLSQEVLGSVEYAVKHLGVNLVMVLGHDNCGAVKSAIKTYQEGSLHELSPHLKSVMLHIYPAIEKVEKDPCRDLGFLDHTIKENVQFQVDDLLKRDSYIAEKVAKGQVMVVAANYNIKTSEIELY